MAALRSPAAKFKNATPVLGLLAAQSATVDYCTTAATDLSHTKLRDLTPLEAMYAYFGADEAVN